MADRSALDGMARFGISSGGALGGISVPVLRAMAKRIGRDHSLAADLWASGIHEARLLAGMVDDPAMVTEKQMEAWAAEFDSWDVVDGTCGNLFDKTASDDAFRRFFPIIEREAGDPRNFVRKAVNWACARSGSGISPCTTRPSTWPHGST